LLLAGKPIGVVQIFNFDEIEIEVLLLLANRMASEVDKAAMIAESQKHSARLETLLEVIRALGSTLDRNQILKEIVFRGRDLLDVEACSIFLIAPKSGDVHFYTTTQTLGKEGVGIYVPKDEGIVGEVIRSGESMIVDDVSEYSKHYKVVDELTGFTTKSLLAAPLKAAPINLGAGKGRSKARTLGVIQALNKNQRAFNQADLELLESLALQAGTVLHIAGLYSDAKDLFMGFIEALGEAIDAKDPYTQNHSKRVATVSAAIGMEMGLPAELQNTLYVGGILHDLGKIGVPDYILTKAGKLEDEEYEQVKQHPAVGKRILRNVKLLEKEKLAIAEHHERLDGTGYPQGLNEDEISLIGRIVAVADVFDALITDRPYRSALSLEEVITYLRKDEGVGLDGECVEALVSLCERGEIYTGG
jgi:putative nucleotidyltransferase with HDIG domain